MHYYLIHHLTTYQYSEPVTESMMELRLEPMSDETQRCLRFEVTVSPKAYLSVTQDYLGNLIHSFNVAPPHKRLAVTTESVVERLPARVLPDTLARSTWDEIDALQADYEFFEMLQPSTFTHSTPLLESLAKEIGLRRRADPLSLLRELNARLYDTFDYAGGSTAVDSPIDDVLQSRRGVCQDFVHVMLTLVRGLGIPARYVSGYLFHRTSGYDRSAVDSSHAWMEAYLPTLGWVSFDPTNNALGTERHIRVAVGRDYADVPPTKGVFRGEAETTLKVAVKVERLEHLPARDERAEMPTEWRTEHIAAQQQQQQ
jgi:transglutaminase-like putative cysteine protease